MVSQLRTSILVEFFFKPMEFADFGYLHIITSCPSSSTGDHRLSWKSVASFDEEVGTAAPVGHHPSQVLVLFHWHFQVSSLLVLNRCLKLRCAAKPNQDSNRHLWCNPQVHWFHLGWPVPTTYLLGIRKPRPERPGPGGTSAWCKSIVVVVNQLAQHPSFQNYVPPWDPTWMVIWEEKHDQPKFNGSIKT